MHSLLAAVPEDCLVSSLPCVKEEAESARHFFPSFFLQTATNHWVADSRNLCNMAPTSHPASSRLVLSHIASPPARHQRRHPCDNESYGAVRRFYGAPVKCWRHSRAERRWRSHTNSQRLLKALTQLLNDGRAAASRAEQLI